MSFINFVRCWEYLGIKFVIAMFYLQNFWDFFFKVVGVTDIFQN